MKDYREINSEVIDSWCEEGWIWGQPVSHEIYEKALNGVWGVYLTPTKLVPHEWFGDFERKETLGTGQRRRTADSHIFCAGRPLYGSGLFGQTV